MANIRGGHPFPYILIRDEKADGTEGGTFSSGAWRTRDLNTEVEDTDNLASVASNQITLEKGIWEALIMCPARGTTANRARLQNITDGTTLLMSHNISPGTGNEDSLSVIRGRFTITAQKVLEVQHQGLNNEVGDGFGSEDGMTLGVEIYTVAQFWRVGFVT